MQQGRSKAVTSSDPDFNSNLDRRTYIKPAETMVLADIRGPAVINYIWLTFNDARPNWLESGGSARPDEIVLRMYYLGSYTLTPGTHTLRFESVGGSPFSTGSALGLDSVRLRERWHAERKSLRPAQPR